MRLFVPYSMVIGYLVKDLNNDGCHAVVLKWYSTARYTVHEYRQITSQLRSICAMNYSRVDPLYAPRKRTTERSWALVVETGHWSLRGQSAQSR